MYSEPSNAISISSDVQSWPTTLGILSCRQHLAEQFVNADQPKAILAALVHSDL
ncbi:hypothetical protein NKJ64_16355 [Mesorhizobium sp. M0062]|uniref:hypothetical protein n=1 Tax=Mesorhizobium sp. M0062 TaxID=2956867 RepID=UPI003336D10C